MFTRLCFATVSVLMLTLFGCASGGPDTKPRWVEAPESDIPAYTTFGWADRSGEPPVTILDNQIRDAIRAGLLERGYTESSDAPDFLVSHETFEHDTVQQGNPVRIGIGVGSWGGNVGGSVGTSVDVGDKERVVQQLRVTIRALDPDDSREVWIGTTAPVNAQPDRTTIDRAVAGVMKGFPEKRG